MKHTKTLTAVLMLMSTPMLFSQQSSNVQMPVGKQYFIQSAMNYGINFGACWDIPGSPQVIQRGDNIATWDLDQGMDRKYSLIASAEPGFYEIYIGSDGGKRVDVAGGNTSNGTNIGVWDVNGTISQRFAFVHLGNGRFKIYTRSGKIICLADRSNANGSNVHIWDDHNGPWCEWVLMDANNYEVCNPTAKAQASPNGSKTASPQPQVMPTKR